MAESAALLRWRKKQKRGAIMKPSTFASIARSAAKKYGSKEAGRRAAGAEYWRRARAKFRKRKKS